MEAIAKVEEFLDSLPWVETWTWKENYIVVYVRFQYGNELTHEEAIWTGMVLYYVFGIVYRQISFTDVFPRLVFCYVRSEVTNYPPFFKRMARLGMDFNAPADKLLKLFMDEEIHTDKSL